jgi:hypothetical protein
VKRAFLLACVVALACAEDAREPGASDAAPVAIAAAVAIEPPRLRLGDVATVEVSVVTPPAHEVGAIRPPAAVEKLWLLDAEALPVETSGAREIRRTRIRVRAREVGATEWPALTVEVEAPDGAKTQVATEPRPLEVVSVLPLDPERTEPFSYRLPTAAASSTPPGVAAALGAAGMLALLGIVALARRGVRRARARREAERIVAATQPWVAARAALAEARAMDPAQWREAAAAGARALRHYVAARWGVGAIESAAREELGSLPKPYLRAQRWDEAIACLRDLDGERFRARPAAEAAAQIAAALAAADRFVVATSPRPDDEESDA